MPTVSIRGNSNTYRINIGENLLAALEQQGLKLLSGCCAGTCGVCKIEILKGDENLNIASKDELETIAFSIKNYERKHGENAAKNKKIRLACLVKIIQDGVIELAILP